jgi:tetratricopeptide (TPR) repeat protein
MMRPLLSRERDVARARLFVAAAWIGVALLASLAEAQTLAPPAPAQTTPVKKTCKVNSAPPTVAETALNKEDYVGAEKMFQSMLASDASDAAAYEGLVRALLEQDEVDIAAKDAQAWIAIEPGNSTALVALGDVRLRQGSPRDAFLEFQKAAMADPCNARAYYGEAEVDSLAGLDASAKRAIEQAYGLHPTDDDIYTRWLATRPRTERLEKWRGYAEHSDQIAIRTGQS